ncbi:MAG: hypothetical protein MJ236_02375 [Clostridia bacterium]|nr:hypothetical protein [Clostridia bacterium]
MAAVRKFVKEHWIISLIITIIAGNLLGGLYRLGGKNQISKICGIIQLVLFVAGIALGASLGVVGFVFWVVEIIDIVTLIIKHDITVLAD